MAISPRGNPILDLQGVRGGLHLDDDTRPIGAHRYSVNIRNGQVRPGSQVVHVASAIADATLLGGLYNYRAQTGEYWVLHLGFDVKTDLTPKLSVLRGLRLIDFGYLDAVNDEAQFRIPSTWAALERHVLVAGPLAGQVGHCEFNEDGTVTIQPLVLKDREVDPFVEIEDDDGPYLTKLPSILSVFSHQDRVFYITTSGEVYFSNLRDPVGIPANNVFLVSDGDYDRTIGGKSFSNGMAVICQRDGFLPLVGDLHELRGTTLVKSTSNIGPVSQAGIQVVGGMLYFMSTSGPMVFDGRGVAALGGPGAIGPLFNSGADIDTDLELYRPTGEGLAACLSRYSQKNRRLEWCWNYTGSHLALAALSDLSVRVTYSLDTGAWSLEVHPTTTAFAAVEDGNDDEFLIRAGNVTRLFIEDVGDYDEKLDWDVKVGWYKVRELISATLDLPPVDVTPERGIARYVYVTLSRNWDSEVTVSVLPEGRSRNSEADVTVKGEDRDLAFSASAVTGFTFGSDMLESEQVRVIRRGLPSLGAGRRIRVRLHTPTGSPSGHRWEVKRVQVELSGGGRTP